MPRWGMEVLILCGILALVGLVVTIFFLLTLHRALARCSPECRTMAPGLVWLLLVPVFAVFWEFYVVIQISKSLECELTKRQIPHAPHPGRDLGIAMSALWVLSAIPFVGIVAAIAGLVCWILYWARIAGFSSSIDETYSVGAQRPAT